MPKSIATAVAPLPRHHDEPQQPQITLHLDDIRQVDGLYCLNDLHKMAGGRDSDKPHRFLRLDKTQKLIQALEQRQREKMNRSPFMGCEQVFITVNGGNMQGSYGSRKLVIAYANWIDPYINDMVLEVFDRVVTGDLGELQELHTLTSKFNYLNNLDTKATTLVSNAGYILVVGGKQLKPLIKLAEKALLNQIQLSLPFTGE